MKKFSEFMQLEEKLMVFGKKAYPKFGNVLIMAGGGGCYPKGTEYFTGFGWKSIDEYDGGDVLQFDKETGIATMVKPDGFVKLPVDQFYRIKNRRVDFVTSEDHKHLLISDKTKKFEVRKTSEIVEKQKSLVRGNKSSLVTSFKYGATGVDMTDDEIRLRIAIIADGHLLPVKQGNKFRVRFTKERKIKRYDELLKLNGIEPISVYKEGKYTVFEHYSVSDEKEFSDYWYNASNEQLKVICDEVLFWDGTTVHQNSFFTTNKKSLDFVQFAFSSIGKTTSVYLDTHKETEPCYCLTINNSNGKGISKDDRSPENTTTIDKVDSEDGMMYCFTVPTGFFVVRQNDQVFVSGNSGKGFVASKLVGLEGITLDVDHIKELAMASTKLSARIKAETGHDIKNFDLRNPEHVSTLHGLLANVYKTTKKMDKRVFDGVLSAAPDRKPNLIFDMTMKDMGKLAQTAKQISDLGYDKKNIHIVWVMNKIDVAIDQNEKRSRRVPVEILISAHEGAAMTWKNLMAMGEGARSYADGDWYISFNQVGVDTEMVKSGKGGSYIKEANYMRVKQQGKAPMKATDLDQQIVNKISDYIPNPETWAMLNKKK